MKIAIVHDWLTNMGGAEQVVINFKEVFKECLSYNNYVVLGNGDSIDKSKLEFDKIIEL